MEQSGQELARIWGADTAGSWFIYSVTMLTTWGFFIKAYQSVYVCQHVIKHIAIK